MASAKKKENVRYALKLTQAEIEALAVVLSRVGGDPEGPRGKISDITTAIQSVGVTYQHTEAFRKIESLRGEAKFRALYFTI